MTDILVDRIGNSRHAYFIGIGGAGMSSLARVLKYRGLKVSGSDIRETRTTRELMQEGIQVYLGQDAVQFQDVDLVIYSTAIDSNHLELAAARKLGLKIRHRAEILSSLFNQAETAIAVSGTHGKTTTSSMISYVLHKAGKKPTCMIGGDVLNLGTNAVLGNMNLWVSEVDESDKSHELYAPTYAVLTNLEEDHMDHYKDIGEIEASFVRFLSNFRSPHVVIHSADDARLVRIVGESGWPRIQFGLAPSADYSAQNIRIDAFGSEFDFHEAGFYTTTVKLSVPGIHNVMNALGVMAVLIQLGLDPSEISRYLTEFCGARRRLEIKCRTDDYIIIDDYAHHPTEVKASIRALRGMSKHVTVIFQPHRFSRTSHFINEFAQAFGDADELILTEVYSAGEKNDANISVQMIYDQIKQSGRSDVMILGKKEIADYLLDHMPSEGVIAFLGAGDIGEVADEFAKRFKNLATTHS